MAISEKSTKPFRFKRGDPEFLIDYNGQKIRYPFYESLDGVEQFTAEHGDIVIASFPKAGTTLLSTMVLLIQNDGNPQCLQEKPLEEAVPCLEICSHEEEPGNRRIDRINRSPHPRIVATHLFYDSLPISVRQKAKIIYVIRNIKDTIVSLHPHSQAHPGTGYDSTTLEDTVNDLFTSNRSFMPYFDHLAGYWRHRNDANVLCITYEDVLKDFRGEIIHLATFLGKKLTEEQLNNVQYYSSFDVMKTNVNTNRSANHIMDQTVFKFQRSGRTGGWRKKLTVAMNERINKWLEEEGAKYAADLEGLEMRFE